MDRDPSEMNAHFASKKRQYVRRRRRRRTWLILLGIAALLAVWLGIFAVAYRVQNGRSLFADTREKLSAWLVHPAQTEALPDVTAWATTVPASVGPEWEYTTVSVSNDGVFSGDLILVSTLLNRRYVFPENADLCTVYGNKSSAYRVSNATLMLNRTTLSALNEMFDACLAETGKGDYQITQGYRSLAEQTEIYDSYQETYGPEQGALLAALPGYSEHHSGYAFDMNVYTKDGVSYSLGSAYEVDPVYGWIYAHAAEYGFVLRYPAEKTQVTGITNEPWHFRYVGRGHAAYMTENGLTLEEYIGLLYRYGADGEHLCFAAGDVSYEVYYCPADFSADQTSLPIPADAPYTVSGDNESGFIVTVTR